MSGRGAQSGRGRARGRGKGRGRGRTMIWEWESYTPGPEVYDQLWHIRREPVVVTPYLSDDNPISDARTRILDRRQTEGDIIRNYYVVEITHSTGSIETEEIDQSRILQFVSPAELERFENAEFKAEADAEAVTLQMEAKETARRRLERNARTVSAGRGNRMLPGLGTDLEIEKRGRRSKGRGRGRSDPRGRGGMQTLDPGKFGVHDDKMQHEDGEGVEEEAKEVIQDVVAETDSEDELAPEYSGLSPSLLRSAFVANSALPVSPVTVLRRRSIPFRELFSTTETKSEDQTPSYDAYSVASLTKQLRLEDCLRIGSGQTSERASIDTDSHRSKRQRTDSTSVDFVSMADSSEPLESHPHQAVHTTTVSESPQHHLQSSHTNGTNNYASAPIAAPENEDTDDNDESAEEYAVEAILEHYCQDGKRYYLVKWEGYEDSHDWLPEEDLEGASELVREYRRNFRRREKARARALENAKGKRKHTQ